ncbi:hypothetical protein CHCC20441_0087 [Bacillus licheniformis]|nr:hypothetical protein MUY_004454 [Bacillus licheniformis WX-02]KYC78479.1 hypothetical protein B4090_4647 [Bacillus licheniformis]KYC82312.1 hypothetical protein B4091_4671 [Bacillus licheniformis]TWJ44625.1 hypothetical protein CHCC5025_2193 [Bacillus licheniformis]TWJ95821.1 hypothetical protein CHCC20493_3175 [Bacillus licheniformis]
MRGAAFYAPRVFILKIFKLMYLYKKEMLSVYCQSISTKDSAYLQEKT